jgi:hypothetical protein
MMLLYALLVIWAGAASGMVIVPKNERYTIMLSSTFLDLRALRAKAEECLQDKGFFVDWMEADGARPGYDVLSSSRQKVDRADGYLLVIGERYGTPVEDTERNPDHLSTTHLEYRWALEAGIPIAVVTLDDKCWPRIERETDDLWNRRNAFAKEAKGRAIHGYVESEGEFKEHILKAADGLHDYFRERGTLSPKSKDTPVPIALNTEDRAPQPAAPGFYEARPFARGMDFVGRKNELDKLGKWLCGADPMLVFQAMGGMGKSTVAHEWISKHAQNVAPNLAGRIWYSFYEEGASVGDFCRHTLAYIHGRPASAFNDLSHVERRAALLIALQGKPFLIVMDGLERILRAYAMPDKAGKPAEIAEEDADRSKPRDEDLCIDPEDDRFLVDLLGLREARFLVTTRNLPEALLNEARKPTKGVKHLYLEGFDGADAVELLKQAGVYGDDLEMSAFVSREFGGHPLMIGVVAGLIDDYARAPGNFDAWSKDPEGRATLNLAERDSLKAKRQHILKVAFDRLSGDAKAVLMALAYLAFGLPYENIARIAEAVAEKHGGAIDSGAALRDLRDRRIVSYARSSDTYDLHPLVRAVARQWQFGDDRNAVGSAVVDYSRNRAPSVITWESAGEEIDRALDLADVMLSTKQAAAAQFIVDLPCVEICDKGRVRRFFAILESIEQIPEAIPEIFRHMDICLFELGEAVRAKTYSRKYLNFLLSVGDTPPAKLRDALRNLSVNANDLNNMVWAERWLQLSNRCGDMFDREIDRAYSIYMEHVLLMSRGQVALDDPRIDYFGAPHSWRGHARHHDGLAIWWAWHRQFHSAATEGDWQRAVDYAVAAGNVGLESSARRLLAFWLRGGGRTEDAEREVRAAINLLERNDMPCSEAQAELATLLAEQGQITTARDLLARIRAGHGCELFLAEAWFALGEREKAAPLALCAYRYFWGDGPPYARANPLRRTKDLLDRMGITPPALEYRKPENLPSDPLYDRAVKAVDDVEKLRREGPKAV